MSLDVFLTFNGNCRQALAFYAGVFKQQGPDQIMTYGQNPGGGVLEADKNRVLYACMPLFGRNVMFSDCPSDAGGEYVAGNNIMLTIGLDDEGEIRRVFGALGDGGEVYLPLGKTFFSELFGMVRDRFGVIWQVSKAP